MYDANKWNEILAALKQENQRFGKEDPEPTPKDAQEILDKYGLTAVQADDRGEIMFFCEGFPPKGEFVIRASVHHDPDYVVYELMQKNAH